VQTATRESIPIVAASGLATVLAVPAGPPLPFFEQLDHDPEQQPLILSAQCHVPELCTFATYRTH